MRWRRLLFAGALLAVAACAAGPLSREHYQGRARRALQDRRVSQALNHLEQIERFGLADAETEFLLARTKRHLGRFDAVRRHLLRARDLGHPVEALKREQWLALAQTGQMSKAEPHLRELLINPGEDGREICEAFVQGYCVNLRFEAAFSLLDVWQAEFPDDAEPHFRRGYIQQSAMNARQAVEHYERGLKMAPHRSDARLRLAQTLLQLNRVDEAETQLRQLQKELPHEPEVKVGLATCLSRQGRLTQARTILRDVHEQHPHHFAVRRQLGELAAASRDYGEALRWLEPLKEERPYDPAILQLLAQAYRASGKMEAAQRTFEALRQSEKLESRLDDLLTSILQRPRDVELRYEIGMLLTRMGLRGDSARWLRSILEIEPQHAPTHQALAELEADAGNQRRAERHRSRAEESTELTDDGMAPNVQTTNPQADNSP